MYTLMIKGKFDSAHFLPDYDGKCKNMHGHTWHIKAGFRYETTYIKGSKTGMSEDFTVLKNQMKHFEDVLDHKAINEVITMGPPTAERIAEWIFNGWKVMNNFLAWIELWETEGAGVRYEPMDQIEIGGITIDIPQRK